MPYNINVPAFITLVIYPLFLALLLVYYCFHNSLGWFEFGFLVAGYYGAQMAVCVGLHRLWSHNAFQTNKYVEFVLVMLTAGALQGPVLAWASDHYKHHSFTDKDQDPHTPLKYKSRIKGFLWAHMGWMLFGEDRYKHIDRVTIVKLGRNKLLRWQLKYYWKLAILMNALVPAVLGLMVGGTMHNAFAGFLFLGVGRALQQQATFCVNSLCHFMGNRKYYKGTARDIWWMAIFLLGENWHNFHHAFPSDYRNGSRWYHMDINKWIIYTLSKLGLAHSLDRTAEVRVQAKMRETSLYFISLRQEKLNNLTDKASDLLKAMQNKLTELDSSKVMLQKRFAQSLVEVNHSLESIFDKLKEALNLSDAPSEKWLQAVADQLQELENKVSKLYRVLA